MYIAKVLSNLGAWEFIREKYPNHLAEIENVITLIEPQWSKLSYERSSQGKKLISPRDLSQNFKNQLNNLGWVGEKRKFGTKPSSGISKIDAVKDNLGIEYLFGKFAFVESNLFVKFPIFIQAGIIDLAIIIMPMKILSHQMVSGISSLEMVENRLDEIPAQLPKYPFVILGIPHEPSSMEVRELNNPFRTPERLLRVFLCHSSGDKQAVRELNRRLLSKKRIDPWLDEDKLLPGVDWDFEITKAVKTSDVVIVCISQESITKEGYVQKEIKRALDIADEKPEETIFIIPLKLEECEVPARLSRWQYVNYYEENAFSRLMNSLQKRAESLGITIE